MSKGLCSSCGGHGCYRCNNTGETHADVERLMLKGDEGYDMGWSAEDEAAIAAAPHAYLDPVTHRLVTPPERIAAYERAEANLRNRNSQTAGGRA